MTLLSLHLGFSPFAMAQGDLEDDSGAAPTAEKEVEDLYDKEEAKVVKPKSAPVKGSKTKEAQSLSDLATLAPFSDVAVIQRRFLPKTQRFEFSGGAFTNLNNPFYNSIGVSARLAYYLREKYAIEGIGAFATTTTRQVTDDLESRPGCANCTGITTDNLVTSKGFFALAFKWNPIYGKITWLNKTIVPFDINFNFGGGMTMTTENESAPTIHFGTSQVFAWSKAMAFRWDLYWNMYSATAINAQGKKESLNQNDLFLGIGMSFFFPEATYR